MSRSSERACAIKPILQPHIPFHHCLHPISIFITSGVLTQEYRNWVPLYMDAHFVLAVGRMDVVQTPSSTFGNMLDIPDGRLVLGSIRPFSDSGCTHEYSWRETLMVG